MPKPQLIEHDAILESQIIDTLLAGLKYWRPDLRYPESHSDMQGCVRALLTMFKIERLPLVVPLKIRCHRCESLGHLVTERNSDGTHISRERCPECKGFGWIPGYALESKEQPHAD